MTQTLVSSPEPNEASDVKNQALLGVVDCLYGLSVALGTAASVSKADLADALDGVNDLQKASPEYDNGERRYFVEKLSALLRQ